jgi:4-methyl-5(b-hydroxyethyl)-thiazole monophosphate biosynthesis
VIYIFLADGFEEIEAIAPIDMLRRAGLEVKIVGIGKRLITSGRGVTVTADIVDSEAVFDNLQMVVLPGGMPGAENLFNSEIVKKFIIYANENNIYIGAICAAPFILGKMGLLNGIKAICYPGYEKDLLGAIIADEFVATDKNFVTAKGAGVAIEFGLALVSALCGNEKAEKIKKQVQKLF